jgi:hypothetical protein
MSVPAVVISVARKGVHAVSEDAKRIVRVIAAYVSEQLAVRDYLSAGKKPGSAKRFDELFRTPSVRPRRSVNPFDSQGSNRQLEQTKEHAKGIPLIS